MKFNAQHTKIKLDNILIQFGPVLNGTWHNGRRNVLTGAILRRYQKCTRQNQRAINETRKEELKSYTHKTIRAIGPARLVPTKYHHKLPTTSLTL